MESIYSIGYAAFSVAEFVDVLKSFEIRLIVDVRSQPYSSNFNGYNKENISNLLKKNGIYYKNYANEFGARQTDQRFFSDEGYLDFEKFSQSQPFCTGYNKLVESIKCGYTFAFMCAEKIPATCHRSILVSRYFRDAGYDIKHILQGGGTESQSDIDTQLLNDYFPNRAQLSFFEAKSESELLKEAYRKRNAEIGYRPEGRKNDFTDNRFYEKIS